MSAILKTWAGLDIGTNSVKLLVARPVAANDGTLTLDVLVHDVTITRMGEGLNATGRLGDAPVERTIEAVRVFLGVARAHGAEGFSAAGMEAFRRADNGHEVARRIETATGVPVRILTGPEEAALGREGVLAGFGERLAGPTLVCDPGGGSTELALTDPRWEVSLPLGAVVCTESFLRGDPPSADELMALRSNAREAVERAWRGSPRPQDRPTVVAVGGTATACASMLMRLGDWDPERVHRATLTLDEIETLTDHLAAMTLARRREVVGLSPARAPVIVGGTVLLEAVLQTVGALSLRVSLANLLHAFVLREASEACTGSRAANA